MMDQQKQMGAQQPVWSLPVAVDDVPEEGRHIELQADAKMRAALAARAGVLDVAGFKATFDLARHGRDGLRVAGEIEGTVRQTCVVTLEPMTNVVRESIDVLFAPAAPDQADAARHASRPAADDHVDPPEPLVGGKVDLGVIATEFLLLAIDPYPRRDDAHFEPPAVDNGEGGRAFAALKDLKSGKGT